MNYSVHKMILEAYRVGDVIAYLSALFISAWYSNTANESYDLSDFFSSEVSLTNVLVFVVLSIAWFLIFGRNKQYMPMKLNLNFLDNFLGVVKSTSVGVLLFAAAGSFFKVELFDPLFLILLWVSSTLLTVGLRIFVSMFLKRVHVGDKNQRNVLVIGANDFGVSYSRMIDANHQLGIKCLGFLDDDTSARAGNYLLLGRIDDYASILKDMVVDEIVIAIPAQQYTDALEDLIGYASSQGVMVRFPVYQLLGYKLGAASWRMRAEPVMQDSGTKTLDLVLFSGYQVGWRYIVKRLIDIVLGGTAVIMAAPIMLLTALAVKLSSRGDALFIQDRYGYNGRVFKLYKFRTMCDGADAMQDALRKQNERSGAAFKIQSDPRVTKVGQFLRKTSLDELPQLFNVLKGDMSLVGPRPLPLADYKRIKSVSHLRRLSVLPGITCTWQAGGRDNVSFEEWMILDMRYIDEWRLWSDIKILLATIPAVLFGRGAS